MIDLEVGSVFRRFTRAGRLPRRRAELALSDLLALLLRRVSHRELLPRCWELRDNLTMYDASYVALAEALEVTLVTADAGLSRAPVVRCRVELLQTAPTPDQPRRPGSLSGQQRAAVRAGRGYTTPEGRRGPSGDRPPSCS